LQEAHDDLHVEQEDLDEVFEYIEDYWSKLIRHHPKDLKTLIGLPHSYIVPTDSEIFQEQYYWDSYPVIRALINHPKYSQIAIGMVENFFHMIERFGIIPNASRFYFLSRSQPPLLSSMVLIVYDKIKDLDWLKKAVKYIEFEYNCVWMGKTHLSNFRLTKTGLCRYYDVNAIDSLAEAESGWDLTSRFDNKCLGFYFDYDFVRKRRSHLITVAGVYPLNVGIASNQQAEKIMETIKNVLQKNYGVVQSVRFIENKQWDWPNGWAPLQLRTIEGLMRYGFNKLAKRLVLKWLALNIKVFKETGHLWEKYDVVHGHIGVSDRYPTPSGFAWTNAAFLIMVRVLKFLEEHSHEGSTPVWLVRRLGW